jgi:hypothetical protein
MYKLDLRYYLGIAKNRISLAPLSATQALLQDGKIPIPFSSNPIVEIIEQGTLCQQLEA